MWGFLLAGLVRMYGVAVRCGLGRARVATLLLGSLGVDAICCALFCALWPLCAPYAAAAAAGFLVAHAVCYPLRMAVWSLAHRPIARAVRTASEEDVCERLAQLLRGGRQGEEGELQLLRRGGEWSGRRGRGADRRTGCGHVLATAAAAATASGCVVVAACLLLKYELEERGAVADVPPYAWLIGSAFLGLVFAPACSNGVCLDTLASRGGSYCRSSWMCHSSSGVVGEETQRASICMDPFNLLPFPAWDAFLTAPGAASENHMASALSATSCLIPLTCCAVSLGAAGLAPHPLLGALERFIGHLSGQGASSRARRAGAVAKFTMASKRDGEGSSPNHLCVASGSEWDVTRHATEGGELAGFGRASLARRRCTLFGVLLLATYIAAVRLRTTMLVPKTEMVGFFLNGCDEESGIAHAVNMPGGRNRGGMERTTAEPQEVQVRAVASKDSRSSDADLSENIITERLVLGRRWSILRLMYGSRTFAIPPSAGACFRARGGHSGGLRFDIDGWQEQEAAPDINGEAREGKLHRRFADSSSSLGSERRAAGGDESEKSLGDVEPTQGGQGRRRGIVIAADGSQDKYAQVIAHTVGSWPRPRATHSVRETQVICSSLMPVGVPTRGACGAGYTSVSLACGDYARRSCRGLFGSDDCYPHGLWPRGCR